MEKKILTLGLMILFCSAVFAQREQNKIGYIDMEYILDNISDYKEANNELNRKIETWKGEIEQQQQKIRDLKENLENERPLLTQDLIDERQDEIDYYQRKMQEYQQQRFGPEGDMMAQRRQIMQPIQDEVFNAVQEIGEKREYDFIFDSSADALMLFSAKRHDISDQILAGIRRNSRKLTGRDKDSEVETDKGEEEYKSVIQARLDKEKEEEREALKQEKLDERQRMMDERQRQRDSIRAARQAQFQARRDSIQQQRNQSTNSATERPAGNEKNNSQEVKKPAPTQNNVPQSNETPERETESTRLKEEDQRAQQQKLREQLQAEREAQRDSIKKARQKELEKRNKQRDSIIQARNLERENRKR